MLSWYGPIAIKELPLNTVESPNVVSLRLSLFVSLLPIYFTIKVNVAEAGLPSPSIPSNTPRYWPLWSDV